MVILSFQLGINDQCMTSLGEYLQHNKSVTNMHLDETGVSDRSIEILAPYLAGNITFKRLDISENQTITNAAIQFLLKMIESSHIEWLNIKDTRVAQMNALVIALAQNMIRYGSQSLKLNEK